MSPTPRSDTSCAAAVAALASRAVGEPGPGLDRTRDFLVTYERERVLEAASLLLGKVVPLYVRPVEDRRDEAEPGAGARRPGSSCGERSP